MNRSGIFPSKVGFARDESSNGSGRGQAATMWGWRGVTGQCVVRVVAQLALTAILLVPSATSRAETLRLGGTGILLETMRGLGAAYTADHPETRVEVLPSLGTPGGIRALLARRIDIALTSRPLTDKDKGDGLEEAVCATTAYVFATTYTGPYSVTKATLPSLYANPQPVWPDRTPLKIILRSRAGTARQYLSTLVPGMAAALDAAYARPGMPVSATDQVNAELATRVAGSFAFMTLMQMQSERLALRALPFEGVTPTPQTIADRTYPLLIQGCAVIHRIASAEVQKFIVYMKSTVGQALVRQHGAISAD